MFFVNTNVTTSGFLSSLPGLSAIAAVTDDGSDVTIKLLADDNNTGTYSTVTITLAGIGDGSIDDLQDLVDRDYNLAFV